MKGSCLCGAVAYEADRLAGPIVHCHCTTCRKAHAAAFASTARVAREDFRWTRGAASLGAYESSPGKIRHFCTACGAHLMAHWVAQPQVILSGHARRRSRRAAGGAYPYRIRRALARSRAARRRLS